MFKRIIFSSFLALSSVLSFADGVDSLAETPKSEALSSSSVQQVASVESSVSKGREVPVRYWVNGDSVELEAIFVKIENDTVFLKKPNEAEQKRIDRITDEQALALQQSNGQQADDSLEDENDDVEIKNVPS